MSSKIVIVSICIITMYFLLNCNKQFNKKDKDDNDKKDNKKDKDDNDKKDTKNNDNKKNTEEKEKDTKIESCFIKIEQNPKKQYNCFLESRQLYEYKYSGSIKELNKILDKHNIQYNISAIDQIYLCTKDSINFEIRINKLNLNKEYYIQFIPIAGNITELINKLIK